MLSDKNYQIDEFGCIKTNISKNGAVVAKWRSREWGVDSFGYARLSYKKFSFKVHRIVYAKYSGNMLIDGLTINHKDGNKLNNHMGNLEQITNSKNQIHKYRILKFPHTKGNKKISFEIANKIRDERTSGAKYNYLVAKYGLCKSSISYIVNYRTWNNI